MTAPVLTYITDLREAYQEWFNKLSFKERAGIGKQRKYLEIQTAYLFSCIEIIEHFYSKTDFGNDNFVTVDEIRVVMTRVNQIMGTNIWIDENLASLEFGFTYSSSQCIIRMKIPYGKSVIVDWGDGSDVRTYHGGGSGIVTMESEYSSPAAYSIDIYGEFYEMTHFDVGDNTTFTGDVESITRFLGLTYLDVGGTSMVGSINGVAACEGLTHIDANNTSVSGDATLLWSLILEYIDMNSTALTGSISGFSSINGVLKHIDFGNTSVTGNLNGWGQYGAHSVEYIDLHGVAVTGTITDWGTYLIFLKYIDLHDADVIADISGWTGMTGLEHLDIKGILSGSVAGYSALTTLTYLAIHGAVTGDISNFSLLINLTHLALEYAPISGSLNGWGTLTKLIYIILGGPMLTITGDLNTFRSVPSLTELYFHFNPDLTFDSTTAHQLIVGDKFWAFSCAWTSTHVDNCLIAFYNGGSVDSEIKIAGTNASRTAASDTAYAWLIANGNSVDVN